MFVLLCKFILIKNLRLHFNQRVHMLILKYFFLLLYKYIAEKN